MFKFYVTVANLGMLMGTQEELDRARDKWGFSNVIVVEKW